MRQVVRDGFVLVALGLLPACGGSSYGGGGGGGSTQTDYYVNALLGLDTYAGTSGQPFKTITHALAVATSGKTVHVAPGVYDVGNGETFPLVVPAGALLVGDEPNKGDAPSPTFIRG